MKGQEFTESATKFQVPVYGSRPEKAGLYLALFHGRYALNDQMNDWGFHGPLIGPLEWVHTTYASHIRLKFESREDERRYFNDIAFPDGQDLCTNDDLIEYAGKYYGDWTVFVVTASDTTKPCDTFRNRPRRNALHHFESERTRHG